MADKMPTEKMDSAKILGTFTFKPLIRMLKDVTLDGMGLDFKNDTSLHSNCLCYHCGCYTDFPKCCGAHQSGTVCCFTVLNHCALDPIETCYKTRSSNCCVEQKKTACPKPCWPFCMFQDEPICC